MHDLTNKTHWSRIFCDKIPVVIQSANICQICGGSFVGVYLGKKTCNYMYIKRGYVERKYVISSYVS